MSGELSDRVFRLTNSERTLNDRRTLRRSTVLDRSARAKARRLARTGALEHGIWWKLIWKFAGRQFGTIGENIADGYTTPPTVVRAWMDSPEHRANILAGKYTHMGVGHIRKGGVDWWVQHFGGVE